MVFLWRWINCFVLPIFFLQKRISVIALEIQSKFIVKLGLRVNFVKQGVGNSNTGNVARRFFENQKTTSEITGLDENLLVRFSVILQTIASGFAIDTVNFEKYARETAEYYVNRYDWYKMPVNMHKILIHGSAIIKNAMVPIGRLSEEPQEAGNKDFRNIRQNHTRTFSRVAANEDLLNHLFTSSDPVISSKRKIT
jgi:hypothetical protein